MKQFKKIAKSGVACRYPNLNRFCGWQRVWQLVRWCVCKWKRNSGLTQAKSQTRRTATSHTFQRSKFLCHFCITPRCLSSTLSSRVRRWFCHFQFKRRCLDVNKLASTHQPILKRLRTRVKTYVQNVAICWSFSKIQALSFSQLLYLCFSTYKPISSGGRVYTVDCQGSEWKMKICRVVKKYYMVIRWENIA